MLFEFCQIYVQKLKLISKLTNKQIKISHYLHFSQYCIIPGISFTSNNNLGLTSENFRLFQ